MFPKALAKNTSSLQIGASCANAMELFDEINRKEGAFPRIVEGPNIWKMGGAAEVGSKEELLYNGLRKLGLLGPRTTYVFESRSCI